MPVHPSTNFAFLQPHDEQLVRLGMLAERLEVRWQVALKSVAQLTPSLLAKAFRGELVEQDPNDKPAEKLLERIKVARD
jgi:hypothetical protein